MRSEDDRMKSLELENRRLKIALGEATLAKDVLETLIEIVDGHYQTDIKKIRRETIHRCSEFKNQKVSSMCAYFHYSRAAYYKSESENATSVFSETMILELVHRERHHQPRIGGKKLYWLLKSDIHRIAPHLGSDSFFRLLRKHALLVERNPANIHGIIFRRLQK